ncbi:hypothetical protein [Intrasporangium sp. DVR]
MPRQKRRPYAAGPAHRVPPLARRGWLGGTGRRRTGQVLAAGSFGKREP